MNTTSNIFGRGVFWESSHGMSQGLLAGTILYVSGQLSHDADGKLIGEGDMAKQLQVTFAHIDTVLDHFGATRNQIAETTVLAVEFQKHFATIQEAHRAFLGDHRPASTAWGVTELSLPGQLIEIAAVVSLDLPA